MAYFNADTANKAINYRMIGRILGQLLMVEAGFMTLPLAVCLYYGEKDTLAFLLVMLLTLSMGVGLNLFNKPQHSVLRRRDGLLLASVAWVVFSLFGMLPYIFCSTPLNISEGFFEAMSGFTTTGATVIREVERCGRGILLWRAVTQWIGGLGIILFTLTFIPSLNNNGSLMLFHAEATGITHDKLGARISRTAKKLWVLYTLLTIVLVLMLWMGPMGIFDSLCHGLSAISTGGFSTKNDGIAAYHSPYIKMVLTVFMFVGGVSFGLIISALKKSWRVFWENDVFRTYVYIIAVFFDAEPGPVVEAGSFYGPVIRIKAQRADEMERRAGTDTGSADRARISGLFRFVQYNTEAQDSAFDVGADLARVEDQVRIEDFLDLGNNEIFANVIAYAIVDKRIFPLLETIINNWQHGVAGDNIVRAKAQLIQKRDSVLYRILYLIPVISNSSNVLFIKAFYRHQNWHIEDI